MSHTSPPGTPSGPPHDDRPAPRTSERFFAWVRGLGIVRSGDRWFAGVAGGIADKAGIDPLIVRGIFVVLALLGGPGILLYLVGWLLLPDASGKIHLEDVFRGRAFAGVIVALVITGLLIVLPIVIPGAFFLPWAWGWGWGVVPGWVSITLNVIWWALILPALIIWFIVWLSRGRPTNGGSGRAPAGAATPSAGSAGFTERTETWAESAGRRAGEWGEQFGQRAGEWGEQAGQRAEAWGRKVDEKSREWGEQATRHYEARRLGAAQTVITLACALIIGGAAAAWAFAEYENSTTVITLGIIGALATLAVSMIIAGIRGRYTGWVGFLTFVGVIALIFAPFSSVLPKNTQFVPFGNVTTVVHGDSSDEALVMIAGNATIDLTSLERSDAPREVHAWMLGGNLTVRAAADHPTRVHVNILGGNVRDFRLSDDERRQGGIFVSRVFESAAQAQGNADVTEVYIRLLGGNVNLEGLAATADTGGGDSPARSRERAAETERIREQIAEIERQLRFEETSRQQTQDRLEDLRKELENAQ